MRVLAGNCSTQKEDVFEVYAEAAEIVAPLAHGKIPSNLEDFQDSHKIFHHVDRVYELWKTGDTRPVHMTIGLTNYCNHKCPWCYINWTQAGRLSERSGNATPKKKAINASWRLIEAVGEAKELGLKPRLAWHSRAVVGVDPAIMGMGPIPAVRKLLSKTGLSLDDIDLIELNEAFAAQAIHCIRELGLDQEITNVNGSGISIGHPVGATGAIMTVKIMEELERQDKEMGLVTMCVGGGQGCATIFQRLN
ncbi:MAG: hypothetical protein IH860_04545 [Chloroflexi bacterium]|nr:hypothetical protein [Chloroflexota bacterium]